MFQYLKINGILLVISIIVVKLITFVVRRQLHIHTFDIKEMVFIHIQYRVSTQLHFVVWYFEFF